MGFGAGVGGCLWIEGEGKRQGIGFVLVRILVRRAGLLVSYCYIR